jgi:hypothetical protein
MSRPPNDDPAAPFPAAGHIAKAGAAYEFVPVQWGLDPV